MVVSAAQAGAHAGEHAGGAVFGLGAVLDKRPRLHRQLFLIALSATGYSETMFVAVVLSSGTPPRSKALKTMRVLSPTLWVKSQGSAFAAS